MTTIKVGEVIPSVEEMEALPVGAAVTMKGSKVLTKHAPGYWAHHGDDRGLEARAYWYEGMSLISVPEVYTGPPVGARITTVEQLQALPLGSVVAREDYPSHRAQRGNVDGGMPDQWFDFSNGWREPQNLIANTGEGDWIVESHPSSSGETVKQFAWRFRDMMLLGAERAGQGANRALKVMERMKLPFTPSVGMRITNQHDRTVLPVGTRVYTGDSERFESFGVYVKTERRTWSKVLGGPKAIDPSTALAVVVDEVEGKTEPDQWLVEPATAEDIHKVSVFRAKAWEEGYKEKLDRGWCSEFERVMLRAGVSAQSKSEINLNGHRIGEVVTPEVAATLPVGVILTPVDGGIAWFERVENASNRAGTRRMTGVDYKGHFAPQMRIVSIDRAFGELLQRDGMYVCTSIEFMEALPVGSIIGRTSDNERFRKESMDAAHTWSRLGSIPDLDNWREPALGRTPSYQPSAFSPGEVCQYVVHRMGPRVEVTA